VKIPVRILGGVNKLLAPTDVQLIRKREASWDDAFREWIRESKARGLDPNDLGDERWGSDLLEDGLRTYYLPFVGQDSVVFELGPGTGRLTRHLIGRVGRVVLADYSPLVRRWLAGYLEGKGSFEIHAAIGASAPSVPSATADCAFAHGVFEHLDFDEMFWFLADMDRILKPGGIVAFNFDSLVEAESIGRLRTESSPTARHGFRLQHPLGIEALGRAAGFTEIEVEETGTRIAFAKMVKPR
jgi:SAM-dependent methyltransferase